jgi:hypothetical protein
MHPLLERLGIRPEVQSFFEPYYLPGHTDLIFDYGEHYSPAFHRIPITEAVWIAGEPAIARDVFICGSAMDAIAWLNIHYASFSHTDNLLFVALGASPCKTQIEKLQCRNYHLLFSKNTLGAVCDLKVASFIRNVPLRIIAQEQHLLVSFRLETYEFEQLTLHAFEKAAGYHFGIPAHKPKYANTYLEQLQYGHSR